MNICENMVSNLDCHELRVASLAALVPPTK